MIALIGTIIELIGAIIGLLFKTFILGVVVVVGAEIVKDVRYKLKEQHQQN